MLTSQQYSRYRELLIAENLIGKGVIFEMLETFEMLEIFLKELDAVAAR